jgi:DNA-binding NarL/FixJ family response regulator
MAVSIRIVLADDHPIFRSGLRAILAQTAGITVVAEADDGVAALEQIRELRPDVAVLDLDMPRRDGFGVVEELDRQGLSVPIVFLTMHRSERLLNRAFDMGVRGFVIKDAAINEILECIRMVHAGHQYVSPHLSAWLENRKARTPPHPGGLASGLAALTKTELVILKMIADEKSSKEIAASLFISVRTVDRHRSNLCAKLNLHGANALTKFALSHRSQL